MKTVRRGVVRSLTAGALVLAAGIVLGRAPAAQEAGRGETGPDQKAAEPARPEPPTKEQAAAAAKTVKEGLASKEPGTRIAALRAAASVPHADVAGAVAAGLKDNDTDVRIAAMETLGALRVPEALKELQRLASSDKKLQKDSRVFATLLKEIGRYGDVSSIPILTDKPWENIDAAVVKARIYGLGNIRDVKAVEALLQLMTKGSPLPGEDSPFMPDFRVALARLTGTDQTTNKSLWQKWWNDNKKTFKVSNELLPMPAELQARWDEYWGITAAATPAK
jgi:HEAT repeat protein